MKDQNLRDRLALEGAIARLKQLSDEVQAIHAEFPDLKRSKRSISRGADTATSGGAGRPGPNKGRTFSPEVKARMSEGMRKFWARRKAAAKAKNARA